MEEDYDYYEVLELEKTAHHDAIKKAYKKLAIRWHPDKHHDEKKKHEAEKKFKLISEAYQVLSDPAKREKYDRYGKAGYSDPNGPSSSRNRRTHGSNFGYFTPFQMFHTVNPHFRDPFDLFREFFGSDVMNAQDQFMQSVHFRHHPHMRKTPKAHHHSYRSPQHHPYSHSNSTLLAHRNIGHNPDIFNLSLFHPHMSPFGGAFFSSSSNPGLGSSFRSVSTSSRFINGKCIKTTKVTENGKETVTEEVDGVVTKHYTIEKPNVDSNEIIIIN